MIETTQKLVDDYFQWLKDRTVLQEVENGNDWVRIMTPHLDRHNDCIQFYVHHEDHDLLLTDDGATIEDLRLCGCYLNTPKRKQFLEQTLAGFGINLGENGEDLTVRATKTTFASKKHSLLQAMLAVNDLFYMAEPHVKNLFYEDVRSWLDLSGIRYTPNVKFTGKSGYDHMFNFVIPKYRKVPERFVQAITQPSKQYAEGLIFRWLDTKETREKGSQLYVLLNDSDRNVSDEISDALKNYDAIPVLWSERDSVKDDMAA